MSFSVVMLSHKLVGGGIQNVVDQLCQFYAVQGYDTTVICNKCIQGDDSKKNYDVELCSYQESKGLEELSLFLKSKEKFILFAHTFDSYKAVHLLLKKFPIWKNSMHFVVHVDYYAMYYRWYMPIKNLERSLKYRRLFNDVNLVSVSKGAENALLKQINVKPRASRVVYPPLNIHSIQRESNIVPDDIPKCEFFVVVSRLVKRKNIAMAIKAFAKAKTDLHLVIIGDGPEREFLKLVAQKNNVQNKILFLGWKNNPYPYIKEARALIMTSRIEGFGLTLVESMAVGTPVISTNAKSGPSEILGEVYEDCLVPVDNLCQLISLMEYFSKPLLETRFSVKALQEYSFKFDVSKIAQKLLNGSQKTKVLEKKLTFN